MYFKELQQIIKSAIKLEEEISDKYNSLRERNTIEFQEKMKSESDNISKNQQLKDYNPIEFHNSITSLKQTFDTIGEKEQEELCRLQTEINNSILRLMKSKNKCQDKNNQSSLIHSYSDTSGDYYQWIKTKFLSKM